MCDDGRRTRHLPDSVRRLFGRGKIEEIVRQSQDVATRLERAADRLEDAVDRVDRRHHDRTEDTP